MLFISFNIIILFLVGFLIIKILKIQLPPWGILGKCAILFGIGSGLISFQMFLYSIIKIPFSQLSIITPWFILTAILLLKNLPNLKNVANFNKKIQGFRIKSIFEFFIWTILIVNISLVFLQSLSLPLTAWDGWAMWSFKAKVFFLERMVSPQFLINPSYFYSSPDHPLLFPLIQTWLNQGLTNFDDHFIKIFSFLFYVCILIIFYKTLRSETTRIISASLTLFLATVPIFREAGYLQWGADLPLSYYLLGTIIFLKFWLDKREKSDLILAVIFLSFGAWTKNEGIMFATIVVFLGIIFYIFKREKKKYFKIYSISMLIPLIINVPWQIFRKVNNIPMPYLNLTNIFNIEFFQRLKNSVFFLLNQILYFSNWSLGLFLLFLIPFALWRINKNKNYPYITFFYLIILFQIIGYLAVIAFTNNEIKWQLETVLNGLLLQIFPSLLLLSFLFIKYYHFKKLKKKF